MQSTIDTLKYSLITTIALTSGRLLFLSVGSVNFCGGKFVNFPLARVRMSGKAQPDDR